MARVQLALDVTDLEASVTFYSALFGVGPAKRKPGYANFEISDPPLKLVLFEAATGGTLNHLGVETDGAAEVEAADDRPPGRRRRDLRCRRRHLLLCREGRDVGHRPRRRTLGVVREDGRRRRAGCRFRGRRGTVCCAVESEPVVMGRGTGRARDPLIFVTAGWRRLAAASGSSGRGEGLGATSFEQVASARIDSVPAAAEIAGRSLP